MGFISVVLLILVMQGTPDDSPDAVGMIFGAIACFVVAVKVYHDGYRVPEAQVAEYNRTTYTTLVKQWENTWLCLRCGHKFEAAI